jgi:hypothetical protein
MRNPAPARTGVSTISNSNLLLMSLPPPNQPNRAFEAERPRSAAVAAVCPPRNVGRFRGRNSFRHSPHRPLYDTRHQSNSRVLVLTATTATRYISAARFASIFSLPPSRLLLLQLTHESCQAARSPEGRQASREHHRPETAAPAIPSKQPVRCSCLLKAFLGWKLGGVRPEMALLDLSPAATVPGFPALGSYGMKDGRTTRIHAVRVAFQELGDTTPEMIGRRARRVMPRCIQ